MDRWHVFMVIVISLLLMYADGLRRSNLTLHNRYDNLHAKHCELMLDYKDLNNSIAAGSCLKKLW
jgi:hypothetical protein